MEVDFDKEIDTLLRKAHRDGPVLVGDFASRHLDADEISAFAENAMPENSRALYTAHLADCDRCRKILSNLLMMNAEAAPAAGSPGVITIAERSAPWYRRLFLFPNLAYVMGSLVLVFGGFLAFTLVQNTAPGDMVSQVPEMESTQGGPNFQSEPSYLDGGASSTNTTANAAANVVTSNSAAMVANSNSSVSALAPTTSTGGGGGGTLRDDKNFTLDGALGADTTATAPPAAATQPAPKDMPARERDELAKGKTEEKGAGLLQEAAKPSSDLNLMSQKQLPNISAQSPKQSGPKNRNENQYNRQLENLGRRSAAKKSDKSGEESLSGGRRVVSGKAFERKQGVWYDTTYQGRPTINVRRGSAEFNRLDGGLRVIANSLGGTAVIVWGAKAYRIQ